MAEKEFELDDPYEFVAVRFPVDSAVDQDEVMARYAATFDELRADRLEDWMRVTGVRRG